MTIETNIANREAAERFVAAWLDIGRDDFKRLSKDSKHLVIQSLHDRFAKKLGLECGSKKRQAEPDDLPQSLKEVEEALRQCERIQEICEEVPERGAEFAESVSSGVAEVAETIEEFQRVTAEQQRALDNWESGVSRWLLYPN